MTQALTHSVFQVQHFKQGSYVTIEGNRRLHEFYIILDGSVELQKINPETGEMSSQNLGKGDFFGVISAISGLPELDSAIALTQLTVIAVKRERFGDLIRKNPALAMKIIRSYSLRLRSLDKIQDRQISTDNKNWQEENESLFRMAEASLQIGNKYLAAYMFSTYLNLTPEGQFVPLARAQVSKLPPVTVKSKNHQNIVQYFPNEIVFCEGEPGDQIFVIMEGEVKIVRVAGETEVIMNILGPGQIFGEMALLDNKPRSASAVVVSNTKMAVVSKLNFQITTELNPKLMTKIITVLSERVWVLYKKVINSYIKDMHLRFADLFLILAEQAHAKILPNHSHEYTVTPHELLKMMGVGESEVQNLIRFINLHSFMRQDKGKIYCTDLDVLERYVQSNKEKESKFR
jgi:CRP-like cAMP-binding protein